MPSPIHEALIELFRSRPRLVADLLGDVVGVKPGDPVMARDGGADLGESLPTDYRADLVVIVGEPVAEIGLVVEVQLRRDNRKRFVWPVYEATLRARHECPTAVVVVTPSASVARWAARRVPTGPHNSYAPLVLGPGDVPAVTDPEGAAVAPELAVLSAVVHGRGEPTLAAEIAWAAGFGIGAMDGDVQRAYGHLVLASLGELARKTLEAKMATSSTGFRHKYVFRHPVLRQFERDSLNEGLDQGVKVGLQRAVVAVLEGRGLPLTDAQRAQIDGCTDLDRLTAWVRRAGVVGQAEDLFAATSA